MRRRPELHVISQRLRKSVNAAWRGAGAGSGRIVAWLGWSHAGAILGRILGVALALGVVALTSICALLDRPPVYVEADLVVREARLWLVGEGGESREPLEILPPDRTVEAVDWRGVKLRGATELASDPDGARLHLRSARPFPLQLSLEASGELHLVAPRAGRVEILFENPDGGRYPLRSSVRWSEGLELRARGLSLPEPWRAGDGWAPVRRGVSPLALEGQGPVPQVGFQLPGFAAGGGRTVWVVDPSATTLEDGKGRIEMHVPRGAVPLAVADRLVLVEGEELGDEASARVLRDQLSVSHVEVWRPVYEEAESFVVRGVVHFPGGERSPVPVPRDFLLALEPEGEMRLCDVRSVSTGLSMRVAGVMRSVEVGSSIEFLHEVGPTRLRVWYSRAEYEWLTATIVSIAAVLFGLPDLFRRSPRAAFYSGPEESKARPAGPLGGAR